PGGGGDRGRPLRGPGFDREAGTRHPDPRFADAPHGRPHFSGEAHAAPSHAGGRLLRAHGKKQRDRHKGPGTGGGGSFGKTYEGNFWTPHVPVGARLEGNRRG